MTNIKQNILQRIASIGQYRHADYYLPLFVAEIDEKNISLSGVADHFYKLYKLTQFYTACVSVGSVRTPRSHQTFLETLNDPRGGHFATLKRAINLYPHMDLYNWEDAQGSLEKIMDIIDNIHDDDIWE